MLKIVTKSLSQYWSCSHFILILDWFTQLNIVFREILNILYYFPMNLKKVNEV